MTKVNELTSFLNSRHLDFSIMNSEKNGPLETFWLKINSKGKISDLNALSLEMALSLGAKSEPILIPDFAAGQIKIDFIYDNYPNFFLKDVLQKTNLIESKLPIVLGLKNLKTPVALDLATLPHLILGGTTGSGKSIMLHSIINSLIQKCDNYKLALIDPKKTELTLYERYNKLYDKIAYSAYDAEILVAKLIQEMNSRLDILQSKKCRDISEYHKKYKPTKMPYLVLVIDELSDIILSLGKKFLNLFIKLTQKCRSAGIHVILATQHPSSKILSGELKANFPVKVALKVSSDIHSRVLLDAKGAEKLLGKGDSILYLDGKLTHFQGCNIDLDEVRADQKKRSSWFRF